MKEKEIMEKLQQDIPIPDIVQKKANDAFREIKKGNSKIVKMSSGEKKSEKKKLDEKKSGKKRWRGMWAAAAIAVFALGTTACAAAYVHWSRGLEAEFRMTQEEKQFLEEGGYMSPISPIIEDNEMPKDAAAEGDMAEGITPGGITVEGVTVTPHQMIVDNRFACLSFKVEGYLLEEGKEPCFDKINIIVNGDEAAMISYSSSFYNELHFDRNGNLVYDDGVPANAQNYEEGFVDENGCMEYIIRMNGSNYQKGLAGSSMHIAFEGLGTAYKAEYTPDLEAVWEFDFELKGSDAVRTVDLSAPLGESGATVTYAEISPISLYVNYDFPLEKVEIEGVNQKGESITSTTFKEAPAIMGVRLKDGTILTGIINGGGEGYEDENHNVYTASYAVNRILDTKQVDALLFLKGASVEGKLEEADLYIVPIG